MMDPSLNVLSKEQIAFLEIAECLAYSKINTNGEVNVYDDVDFSHYIITHIPVKFGNVSGDFYCHYNKLTTLEHAPKKVGGDFWCQRNHLTSLEHAPREVGGDFDCRHNNLTSLEHAPREVGGDFDCSDNKLTTLEGAPRGVGGDFYYEHNPIDWDNTSEELMLQLVTLDSTIYNNFPHPTPKVTALQNMLWKI